MNIYIEYSPLSWFTATTDESRQSISCNREGDLPRMIANMINATEKELSDMEYILRDGTWKLQKISIRTEGGLDRDAQINSPDW